MRAHGADDAGSLRAGVDIAPQTPGRGVAKAIGLLTPVAKAIEEQTRSPGLLAIDATGAPVLDRDATDGIRNGTSRCWTNSRRVTFVYSAAGDADSVRRFLGDDTRRRCSATARTSPRSSSVAAISGQAPVWMLSTDCYSTRHPANHAAAARATTTSCPRWRTRCCRPWAPTRRGTPGTRRRCSRTAGT